MAWKGRGGERDQLKTGGSVQSIYRLIDCWTDVMSGGNIRFKKDGVYVIGRQAPNLTDCPKETSEFPGASEGPAPTVRKRISSQARYPKANNLCVGGV